MRVLEDAVQSPGKTGDSRETVPTTARKMIELTWGIDEAGKVGMRARINALNLTYLLSIIVTMGIGELLPTGLGTGVSLKGSLPYNGHP